MVNPLAEKFGLVPAAASSSHPVISLDDLPAPSGSSLRRASTRDSMLDGDKFAGGFGFTKVFYKDYWTLRARSTQLFEENIYAKGIIRRLCTNIINSGLMPESEPVAQVLKQSEDFIAEWSENVESRFHLWAKSKRICDVKQQSTFGEIQVDAFREALIGGDVLRIIRIDRKTNLPKVSLIPGASVQTPVGKTEHNGNEIKEGVEVDKSGRHLAYWVRKKDGLGSERVAAWGEKSGRSIAQLVYASDKRIDDVRGMPILGVILQSLKEVDRYKDAVQRKAIINSVLALFMKKTEDKPGSLAFQNGAVRKDEVSITDNLADAAPRDFEFSEYMPGMTINELQHGEEPVGFGNSGIDEKFGEFEAALVQSIAWALEIPPEILRLSFNSNYSASQAANNEFNLATHKNRMFWGNQFCQPIYTEWLVSEVLNRKITAPGFLESWRNSRNYDLFAAWTCTDWVGAIKPSADPVKTVKALKMAVDEGFTTRARATRELNGMKYASVIKQLKRENEQKAEALEPLQSNEEPQNMPEAITDLTEAIEDLKENA